MRGATFYYVVLSVTHNLLLVCLPLQSDATAVQQSAKPDRFLVQESIRRARCLLRGFLLPGDCRERRIHCDQQ